MAPPRSLRERGEAKEDAARVKARAAKGIPFEGETTLAGNKRNGSVYWRPLNVLQEVTVYELMWGQYLVCIMRRDRDYWERGYYYPDMSSALTAADDWDGHGDPKPGWIRKATMDERRRIEDEF